MVRAPAVRRLPGSLSALLMSEHDDKEEQVRARTDSLINFIIAGKYGGETMRSMVKTGIQAHGKDDFLTACMVVNTQLADSEYLSYF